MNLHTPVLISHLNGREILDSRGNPTVECTCHLTDGRQATSSVPSGASTGSHEAMELRDRDSHHFQGEGVLKAVEHINTILSQSVSGDDPADQEKIDAAFIRADHTPNKRKLGANAILAASYAVAKAGAIKKRVELFEHLADLSSNDRSLTIPTPMFNILNGGAHAQMALDFQEFMIIPNPSVLTSYSRQLEACVTITHTLKKVLKTHRLSGSVGDEGGYAPTLKKNFDALDLLKETITSLHLQFGQDIHVGLDCAANTYFKQGQYQIRDAVSPLTAETYVEFLDKMIKTYRIFTLEDPFPEDNWEDWQKFTQSHGSNLTIIGDDLLVTNPDRLNRAIGNQACNGIIIKPNQIGTVSETLSVVNLAKAHNFKIVVSHRSGETTDTFIADLAVGVGAPMVKFGAPVRGERVAKYNRLLRIESLLDS